jgi:uncharacterized membrane protein
MNFIAITLTGLIIVLLDSIYLYLIGNYFNQQIKNVQGTPINIKMLGVVACYIFIIFGIYYFIIKEKKSITDSFLLGLTTYMIYDLTNYALLNNWAFKTVLIDGIWGGILFALTTFLVYKIQSFHIL